MFHAISFRRIEILYAFYCCEVFAISKPTVSISRIIVLERVVEYYLCGLCIWVFVSTCPCGDWGIIATSIADTISSAGAFRALVVIVESEHVTVFNNVGFSRIEVAGLGISHRGVGLRRVVSNSTLEGCTAGKHIRRVVARPSVDTMDGFKFCASFEHFAHIRNLIHSKDFSTWILDDNSFNITTAGEHSTHIRHALHITLWEVERGQVATACKHIAHIGYPNCTNPWNVEWGKFATSCKHITCVFKP